MKPLTPTKYIILTYSPF